MAMVITEADWKKYIAESIGAFFLTMGGMLAIFGSGGALIVIAAGHGTILAMMIYAFGPYSGGHFNPAVSACMFLQRKLSQQDFLMYLVFQVIGATIGALIAVAVVPLVPWTISAQQGATLGFLTNSPTMPWFSPGGAFLLEILMTFMLATTVSVVVAGGEKMNALSGALIGGTLFACILWGGTFTGASLNPARSLGPAIVSGTNPVVWASIWVYLIAPFLGGALAAFGFMWFKGDLKIHLSTSAPTSASPPSAAPPQASSPPPLPPPSADAPAWPSPQMPPK